MRRNERINSVPYTLLENLQMQETISLKIESPLLHHQILTSFNRILTWPRLFEGWIALSIG